MRVLFVHNDVFFRFFFSCRKRVVGVCLLLFCCLVLFDAFFYPYTSSTYVHTEEGPIIVKGDASVADR